MHLAHNAIRERKSSALTDLSHFIFLLTVYLLSIKLIEYSYLPISYNHLMIVLSGQVSEF